MRGYGIISVFTESQEVYEVEPFFRLLDFDVLQKDSAESQC